MTVSHEQIHRTLGHVEATQESLKERMDRFEKKLDEGFDKVDGALGRIDKRLAVIEQRESERKGAWKTLVLIAGAVSAAVGALFALAKDYFLT